MGRKATETMPSRDEGDVRGAAPDVAVRVTGAMLALAVAAVHVADQGGVTALTSPDWIGWGYRIIEVGGVLTALVLLVSPGGTTPRTSTPILPSSDGLIHASGSRLEHSTPRRAPDGSAIVSGAPFPVAWRMSWMGWAAAALLGVGPFTAYILSRTVGVPGDHGDVGNWGYWVGTVSLFVEAALMVLSVSMLISLGQLASRAGRQALLGRLRGNV